MREGSDHFASSLKSEVGLKHPEVFFRLLRLQQLTVSFPGKVQILSLVPLADFQKQQPCIFSG